MAAVEGLDNAYGPCMAATCLWLMTVARLSLRRKNSALTKAASSRDTAAGMSSSDSDEEQPLDPRNLPPGFDHRDVPALFWDELPDDDNNPDVAAIKAIIEESTPEERALSMKAGGRGCRATEEGWGTCFCRLQWSTCRVPCYNARPPHMSVAPPSLPK